MKWTGGVEIIKRWRCPHPTRSKLRPTLPTQGEGREPILPNALVFPDTGQGPERTKLMAL